MRRLNSGKAMLPAPLRHDSSVVFELIRSGDVFDKPKEIPSLFSLSQSYAGTAFVYLICRTVRRSARRHLYMGLGCAPPIPSGRASYRADR
jgi:hypothetical protein